MQNKTAIITGASRGIGRASALALSQAGFSVIIHATSDRNLLDLQKEIETLGGHSTILTGDVTDPDTATRAMDLALSAFGRIDVLVNNAGINTRSSTLDMPLEDWTRVLDVNLNGTLHFCRAVLPDMIKSGAGRIINVSSTTGKTPHKNAAPAYGASKAAVNYLTMHLAREMAPHGITVNAVCPGPVETDMSQQWTPQYREAVTANVPIGRLGTPEEIAAIVAFLASDGAGFITGETINANGGTYMN